MSQESGSSTLHTADAIQAWLLTKLADILQLPTDGFDLNERFSRYGLKSAQATALIADLATALGRPLSATVVWDYPTIRELSRHLGGEARVVKKKGPPIGKVGRRAEDEPIAVTGMSCRFPGGSNTPSLYWKTLTNGEDTIGTVPAERWSLDHYYDEDLSIPGKMSTRWGGFIDNVYEFDPGFFGISPRETIQMDPQQRLMMELSWEALEDTGCQIGSLKGSRTGVFFGAIWNDYASLLDQTGTDYISQHSATGSHYSIIANRVSYTLGFQGPSLAVDTACSSSLVAIHLAVRSLRSGESNLALAGGVNLVLAPHSTVAMSKFGAMSPDGRSKAFDSRANGYVRGEGAGVVALKPLSSALADGDRIYCVIRSSAMNNDGFSNGLTAPNPQAQEAVLEDAYRFGGIDPRTVHYVETHGTGTILGDPIEAKALGGVLGNGRDPSRPLLIGSVKTNMGHLEAAAGIAGIIKVILAIKNKQIPPSLHFIKPNPHIPFEALNIKVKSQLGPWPGEDEPALAGVSSFGFGGTNCHVVLSELPLETTRFLPISGKDKTAVIDHCRKIRTAILDEPLPLSRLAYTTSTRLSGEKHRIGILFKDRVSLLDRINAYLSGHSSTGLWEGEDPGKPPKIAFVCSGQGSQWIGMGRELMRTEPIFRAKLEQCDKALTLFTDWSLLEELARDGKASRLDEVDVIQPALFAIQVSLASLWMRWGIVPDAVVGHSMGEVAAAHISGTLSLLDAARVIVHRSLLLKTVSGEGKMSVIGLGMEQTEQMLIEAGISDKVCLASCNGQNSSVISGDPAMVEKITQDLESRGIFAREIKVDVASHSHQMDPLCSQLFENVQGLQPTHSSITMVSSVAAEPLDGHDFGPSYWVRNLRKPVLFSQSIEWMLQDGFTHFLELSPHPLLSNSVEECMKHSQGKGAAFGSMIRGEDGRACMLDTLARLYITGFPVHWNRLHPTDMKEIDIPGINLPLNVQQPPTHIDAYPFVFSGHTPKALMDYGKSLLQFLKGHQQLNLQDICYTSCVKKNHHQYRAAYVGTSRKELINRLEAFQEGDEKSLATGQKSPGALAKIVFVFSGVGSAWAGMGKDLFQREPLFRSIIEECDVLYRQFSEDSIINAIIDPPVNPEPGLLPSAFFSIQMALARLWRSWGIHPYAVTGLGTGEVAAACVAGILTLSEGLRVVHQRSKWLASNGETGRTLLINAEDELVSQLVDNIEGAKIRAFLSRSTTAVSVRKDALVNVEKALGKHQIKYQILPGPIFYVDSTTEMTTHLRKNLRGLSHQPPSMPIYSSTTGSRNEGWDFDAAYWGRNFESPSHFSTVIANLAEAAHEIFLEIGTEPVLEKAIAQTLKEKGKDAAILPSIRMDQDERVTMLQSLGRLFTLGHPVDWKLIYPEGGRQVTLPPLAWQRETYRLQPKENRPQRSLATPGVKADDHPLLGGEISTPLGYTIYQNRITINSLAFLGERLIKDVPHISKTAILEMALSAASKRFDSQMLHISKVRGYSPIIIPKMEVKNIQLILSKNEKGIMEFQCYSKSDEAKTWEKHMEGLIQVASEQTVATIDIDRLQSRFSKGKDALELIHQESPISYGPKYKVIDDCRYTEKGTLARIKLPEKLKGDGNYICHPILLEAIARLARAGSKLHETHQILSLKSLEGLHYSGIRASDLWVEANFIRSEDDQVEANINIYDQKGQRVIRAEKLVFQTLDQESIRRVEKDQITQYLYEIDWQPRSPQSFQELKFVDRHWLIFDDAGPISEQIVQELDKRGQGFTRVFMDSEKALDSPHSCRLPPQNKDLYQELLNSEPFTGILFLWSLKGQDPLKVSIATLNLIQTLVAKDHRNGDPKLWVITSGATNAGGAPEEKTINQSVLWGMGRTIELEYPRYWGGMIDLPHEPNEDEIQIALNDIGHESADDQVAIRQNQRFVARLVRAQNSHGEEKLKLKSDASYLVTGGFGALGLEIAKWLAESGARHLILAGRRGITNSARATVKVLKEKGVTITVLKADVAQADQLETALAAVKKETPPLKGLLHCAGVLADGAISSLTAEKFEQVFAPKVKGSWNLHNLTKNDDLDFFVLFSSITAAIGSRGQANYSAANTFQDALAAYRCYSGLPALSIGWGPWDEIGMAADMDERALGYWHKRGIKPFPVRKGLIALEHLLLNQQGYVGFADINWENFPGLESSSFYSELARDFRRTKKAPESSGKLDLPTRLGSTGIASRLDLITDEVNLTVATVLEMPAGSVPDPRKGFFDLGIDSLMAMELKDKLESILGGHRLPQTFIFDYPTVDDLVTYLSETVFKMSPAPPKPQPVKTVTVKPSEVKEVEPEQELSDDELETSILEKIRQWESIKLD